MPREKVRVRLKSPIQIILSLSLFSLVGTASIEQIVEEVIGGIKPEVVMVELDSDRICLLPPGEAMEVRW